MTDCDELTMVVALSARGLNGGFATCDGLDLVTITDDAAGSRVTLLVLDDLTQQILAGEICCRSGQGTAAK